MFPPIWFPLALVLVTTAAVFIVDGRFHGPLGRIYRPAHVAEIAEALRSLDEQRYMKQLLGPGVVWRTAASMRTSLGVELSTSRLCPERDVPGYVAVFHRAAPLSKRQKRKFTQLVQNLRPDVRQPLTLMNPTIGPL
jgi:hypothetical protein